MVRTGATPVFVDVDPEHLLVDPEAVEATLGPRTRAIMAVHLFGQMAPMRALAEVGRSSGCPLVEDAAQAHGATQNGTHPGSIGAAAATSFYPGKNLGAYGDAGAVLTDDQDLAQLVRQLRNYGSTTKYVHPIVGFNSRLDTLQAVVLRAKLRRLPTWNQQRAAAASFYDEVLAEHADVIQTPGVAPGNRHVWHLYVVRVSNRDAVVEALHERGIGAGIHYPTPLHLEAAFRELGGCRGDFPVAERAADEILSLPIYPGITQAGQERTAEALIQAVR